MRKKLNDQEVDQEIERLKGDPLVKLAMKERRLRLRRRRYLYDLQWLQKRGRELSEAGWTPETLDRLDPEEPEEGLE